MDEFDIFKSVLCALVIYDYLKACLKYIIKSIGEGISYLIKRHEEKKNN